MTVAAPEADAFADTDRSLLAEYLRARLAGTGRSAVQVEADLPDIHSLGVGDVAGAEPAGSSTAIHLTVATAVIGPVPPPGTTRPPCAQCLRLRWQRLRSVAERTVLDRGGEVTALARSPYLTPFALQAIWTVWSALPGGSATPGGSAPPDEAVTGIATVYEVNLETLRVSRMSLVVDSACPSCWPRRPDTPDRARIALTSRAKPDVDRFHPRSLGSYRLPVDALTNPVCGVIGRTTTFELASPTTSPSVGAFHCGHGTRLLHEVVWTGQTDSYRDSHTAGLFEGLERYAGVEQRRLTDLIVDSYDNVRAHALDPRECGLYPDDVYPRSEDLHPFNPNAPIPWVWGYSLRDERPVLVPRRLAYYGPSTAADNFVHECSNGCASGASLEEAILHGLLELIERDAFLLTWYGRATPREIDLEHCSANARSTADRIRLLGYDVRLFDTRVDLPVPVVVAVAVARGGGLGALTFAAAASLDPDTAVRGALAEIASYVPSMAARVSERRAEVEAMAEDFAKVLRLPDHSALFALPKMVGHADALLAPRPATAPAELYRDWQARRPRSLDLLVDLRHCVDLVVDAGFDVIVVEQTAPEQEVLGLRTVQVIVPGLVPIDFGWSRQRVLSMPRMRTAFRRAGWRVSDLTDADLHRVPHPFP